MSSKQGRIESNVDPNETIILRKHQAPIRKLHSEAEVRFY